MITDVPQSAEQVEKLHPESGQREALEKKVGDAPHASDQAKPDVEGAEQSIKHNLEAKPTEANVQAEARLGQSPEYKTPEELGRQVQEVPPHSFRDRMGSRVDVELAGKADSHRGAYRSYQASIDGQKVGKMDLNFEKSSPNLPAYDQAKITMVEVTPDHRGAGIGGHLVGVGEQSARASGLERIYGDPKNDGARQFLSKQEGWQIQNKPNSYYGEAEKRLC